MTTFLRAACILFFCVSFAPAQAAGLDQRKNFLESHRSARGVFTQTVIARSGKKPQQSAVIFALQRPGKIRSSYKKPYKPKPKPTPAPRNARAREQKYRRPPTGRWCRPAARAQTPSASFRAASAARSARMSSGSVRPEAPSATKLNRRGRCGSS